MMKLVVLFSLAVLCYGASLAAAQRFAPGYCPSVTAHENFDKTRFFGNWIEVEKTPSIFDLMMRCLVVDYSDDQDNTVNVVVRGISLAGLPLTVNGDGLLQDVHRSGFYSIRYGFGVPFQGTLTTIIDTDYDDYAVVYSCTNSLLSGVFHSEYIWVLSRSGKISNPTRQNIYEKLDKLSINRSGLTMSDRSTCPTNSSTVARESDKDLAGIQTVGSPLSGSTIGSERVAPLSSSTAGADSIGLQQQQQQQQQSVVSVLEKAGEPLQKSVVVPLLYDLPSPASSSSVGGASKSGAAKAAGQLAPVGDGKQLAQASPPVAAAKQHSAPVSAASDKQAANLMAKVQESPKQAAISLPVPQLAAGALAAPTVQLGSQSSGPVAAKPSSQQPQQQSLMAKIQQKPNTQYEQQS